MSKTLFLSLSLFLSAIILAHNPININNIDIEKSSVEWIGKKVTGQHTGTISLKSGELSYDNGRLSGGNFVIDMTSIANTDLGEGMKAKLEGHLKSPDFFDVATFPTASLKITGINASETATYSVTGDLTIKNITHPVTFEVSKEDNESLSTTILVDRTLYNVKYGSGKFFEGLGDKMIDDNFELNVKLVTS